MSRNPWPSPLPYVIKATRALYRTWHRAHFRMLLHLFGADHANTLFLRITGDAGAAILRDMGVQMGDRVNFNTPAIFHRLTRRENGISLPCYDNLALGERCHIGRDCFFDLSDRITLEDRVIVAMRLTFISHIDVGQSRLRAIYPT